MLTSSAFRPCPLPLPHLPLTSALCLLAVAVDNVCFSHLFTVPTTKAMILEESAVFPTSSVSLCQGSLMINHGTCVRKDQNGILDLHVPVSLHALLTGIVLSMGQSMLL